MTKIFKDKETEIQKQESVVNDENQQRTQDKQLVKGKKMAAK